MADIRERIAKLLALADSPNEHEAKRALLKARELMAANNLRPEQIAKRGEEKVIEKTIGVFCTKLTDTWATRLSAIVAGHYCCKAFRNQPHHAKKVQVGFIGLEEDFEICVSIYRYTFNYIKNECRKIKEKYTDMSTADIRRECNAYSAGFCDGLYDSFQEQSAEHQEWGLVMVTPQQVMDAVHKMKPPRPYGEINTFGINERFARLGHNAGRDFKPDRLIDKEREA